MLTRREVLVRTMQGVLALSSIQYLSACTQDDDPAQVSPLLEYALAMQGVSYIGTACIEKAGFDRSTPDKELQESLVAGLQDLFVAAGLQGSFQQQFETMIRNDFATNHVVDVEGWQLSATECQMVALAASLQGHRGMKAPKKVPARIGQIAEVEDWGPKSTVQGAKFNEQPDGHSGLWVKAAGVPVSVVVVFADKNQTTQVYADTITSGLRGQFMDDVINTPGEYSVALYDKSRRLIQPIGQFQVLKPGVLANNMEAADLDKCLVEKWGPSHATAGKPFNPQPQGESAFWIKTNCALDGSKLILDGVNLDTTVRKNLLTALVPRGHKMKSGNYELEIKLGFSERILKVGLFRIE